jgi:hypothetical protein
MRRNERLLSKRAPVHWASGSDGETNFGTTSWQEINTNRTVTVAGLDQLRAEFNANAWSGHVGGGYRLSARGWAASALRPTPLDSSPPSICLPTPSRR